MSAFFWSSGHLGWGLLSVVVVSALLLLLGDLFWRTRQTSARKLLPAMAGIWIVVIGAILAVVVATTT